MKCFSAIFQLSIAGGVLTIGCISVGNLPNRGVAAENESSR